MLSPNYELSKRSIANLHRSDSSSYSSESEGYFATSPKSSSAKGFSYETAEGGTSPYTLEQMASFCPTCINKLPPLGSCYNAECVFMLADISGFTQLSSALCSQGKVGLDQLRLITNDSFANFVRIIYSHGGEVVEFAGDSLLCIFLPDIHEPSLEKSSLRAIQCGISITKCVMDGTQTHVAVSNGCMNMGFVGGYNGKHTYIMNGPFMSSIATCLKLAAAENVVVTENVYSLVKEFVTGELLGQEDKYYRITYCTPFSENKERFCRSPAFNIPGGCTQEDVEKCVPAPAIDAIRCHTVDGLAEIRNVTTLFLRLDSFSSLGSYDVRVLQPFFVAMQRCLEECGGFMRQFLIDDKGCVLIGLWGVPTATHAASCSKALRCAVMMRNEASAQSHTISIGITTGSVYCGTVGTDYRRDYVAIGRSVNLAARLMGKARGRILLDKTTHDKIHLDLSPHLAPTEELYLKGIPRAIRYFCYTSLQLPPPYAADVREDYMLGIEGYARRKLNNALAVVESAVHSHPISRSCSNSRDAFHVSSNLSEFYSRSSSNTTEPTLGRSQSQYSDQSLSHMHSMPSEIPQQNPVDISLPLDTTRNIALPCEVQQHTADVVCTLSASSDVSGFDHPFNLSRPTRYAYGGEVCPPTEVFVIKGASGSGKTATLNHFIHRVMSSESLAHRTYKRDAIFVSIRREDDNTPWSAIRKIFNALVAVIDDPDARCEKDKIINIISHSFSSHHREYISGTIFSILKTVLDLQWSWPSGPHDAVRRSCSQTFDVSSTQIVAQLLFYMLSAGVAVLAIDDSHFMCRSTWESLTQLVTLGSSAMLVLSIRTHGMSLPSLTSCNNGSMEGISISLRSSHSFMHSPSPATTPTSMNMGCFFGEDEDGDTTTENMIKLTYESASKLPQSSVKVLRTPARHGVEYDTFKSTVQSGCLHTLMLRPLNERTISNIIQNEGFSNISDDAIRAIVSVSQGTPFLLWKIIEYCHDTQQTNIDDVMSGIADNSLIVTMLERVPHNARSVLKTASVIGEEFDVAVLRDVVPEEFGPSLEHILHILENRGFLVTLFDGVMTFSSGLMRKFAYDLLPPSDAKTLHATVATVLENLLDESVSAHVLSVAYHHIKSGKPTPHPFTFHSSCRAAKYCLAQREVESILPYVYGAFKHHCGQSQLYDVMDLVSKAIRMTQSKLSAVQFCDISSQPPLLRSILEKLNELDADARKVGGIISMIRHNIRKLLLDWSEKRGSKKIYPQNS